MKEEKMSHRTKEVLCAIAINSLITLVLGYCFEQSLWRILFMEFIMLFLNMIIFLVCLPTRGEKLALKEEVIMFGHYLTQSKWAFIALIILTIVYALISPEWSFSIYFLSHYALLFINFGVIRSLMNVPLKFDYDRDDDYQEGE
ncbi:hypothetical protein [Streptococcus pluranimalium]|nr:hypothetical protein [Streptococcus pluranimalium]